MSHNNEFLEYIMNDVLGQIPEVTSRAMFSGHGIYKKGIIFALIVEGALYFKVDEKSKILFEEYGSAPFTYKMKNGKETSLSYWFLPEEIMEDREAIREWVDTAVEVSENSRLKKQ